eukprot:gene60319-82530_t
MGLGPGGRGRRGAGGQAHACSAADIGARKLPLAAQAAGGNAILGIFKMNADLTAASAPDGVRGVIEQINTDLQAYGAANRQDKVETRIASSRSLVRKLEGARLVDLAESLVQLIVRNLYERTADVRLWATDPAFCEALETPTPQSIAAAASRLGVIRHFYSVYSDLILVDAGGRAVATANPAYRDRVM